MASKTEDRSNIATSTPLHDKVGIPCSETLCSLHYFGSSSRKDDSGYFSTSPSALSRANIQLESPVMPLSDSHPGHASRSISKKRGQIKNSDSKHVMATQVKSKTVTTLSVLDSTSLVLPKLSQNFDRLQNKPKYGPHVKKAGLFCKTCQTTPCQNKLHIPGSFLHLSHVDFLTKFDNFNMGVILARILDKVSDRDLCSICCVSRRWRSICLKDQLANNRRNAYLDKTRLEKENNQGSAPLTKGRPRKHAAQKLEEIQNVCLGESLPGDREEQSKSQSEQRFQRFVEEGRRLKSNERLDKCPRCSSPARVNMAQKRAKCSLSGCEFDYCTQCRCEYCIPHKCSPIRPGSRRNISTSKKNAKRNLRRLLS